MMALAVIRLTGGAMRFCRLHADAHNWKGHHGTWKTGP
jgi:hypothetical protein